jgi:hypothetical protein
VADEQSPSDSELTPEQESQVRRLLVEARHDDAIPDTVAARLDRVLAQLAEDDIGGPGPAVDLAARRRRRNAGRLLLAAAAIVVGGVAAGQVLGTQSSGDSADSSAPEAAANRDQHTGAAKSQDAGGDSTPADAPAPTAADQEFSAGELPVRSSSKSFDRDVRRLAGATNGPLLSLNQSDAAEVRDYVGAAPGFHCPPAAYGEGTLLPAYYDDEPTVLAFRPTLGSNRVAELLRCGTAEKLRSVRLDH